MEASHIMNTLRCWPRLDCFHPTLIHTDAIRTDNIPQKGHLICKEGAVLTVAKELFLFKNPHDLGEMVLVLFFTLTIDQNVIEIDHHKVTT